MYLYNVKLFGIFILFSLTGSETPRITQAKETIVTNPQTDANEDGKGIGLSYVPV